MQRLAFLTGDTISPDAQVFLKATSRPYLEKPIKPKSSDSFVNQWVAKARKARSILNSIAAAFRGFSS